MSISAPRRRRPRPILTLATAACLIATTDAVAQSAPGVCDTAAAEAVIDARDAGRAGLGEQLQSAIEATTGASLPPAVTPECIEGLMEGGIGAQISLPTLGDVVSGVVEEVRDRAVSAFCGAVDDAVDGINDTVDDATDVNDPNDTVPWTIPPGVDVDAGIGDANPNNGSGVEAGTTDGATDDATSEVLNGLYR